MATIVDDLVPPSEAAGLLWNEYELPTIEDVPNLSDQIPMAPSSQGLDVSQVTVISIDDPRKMKQPRKPTVAGKSSTRMRPVVDVTSVEYDMKLRQKTINGFFRKEAQDAVREMMERNQLVLSVNFSDSDLPPRKERKPRNKKNGQRTREQMENDKRTSNAAAEHKRRQYLNDCLYEIMELTPGPRNIHRRPRPGTFADTLRIVKEWMKTVQCAIRPYAELRRFLPDGQVSMARIFRERRYNARGRDKMAACNEQPIKYEEASYQEMEEEEAYQPPEEEAIINMPHIKVKREPMEDEDDFNDLLVMMDEDDDE